MDQGCSITANRGPFIGPTRRESETFSNHPDEARRFSKRFTGRIFWRVFQESANFLEGGGLRESPKWGLTFDKELAEIGTKRRCESVRISFFSYPTRTKKRIRAAPPDHCPLLIARKIAGFGFERQTPQPDRYTGNRNRHAWKQHGFCHRCTSRQADGYRIRWRNMGNDGMDGQVRRLRPSNDFKALAQPSTQRSVDRIGDEVTLCRGEGRACSRLRESRRDDPDGLRRKDFVLAHPEPRTGQ